MTITSGFSSTTAAAPSRQGKTALELFPELQPFADQANELMSELRYPHRIGRSLLQIPPNPSIVSTSDLRKKKKQLCEKRKICRRNMKSHIRMWQPRADFIHRYVERQRTTWDKDAGPKIAASIEICKAQLAGDEATVELWTSKLEDLYAPGKPEPLTPKGLKELQSVVSKGTDELSGLAASGHENAELDQLMRNVSSGASAVSLTTEALINHINEIGGVEKYQKKLGDEQERRKNELNLKGLTAMTDFAGANQAAGRYLELRTEAELRHEDEYLDDIAFLDDEIAKLDGELRSRPKHNRLFCFS